MSAKFLKTKDGQRIAYEHYKYNHDKAVIIAHGFFNSKDSILLQRLKNSLIDTYDVIMFDFRGHGGSSGRFSWSAKEELDLEAVLDYTKNKYGTVGIIAFSFGASIAINVLARLDKVDSLVSISTLTEFEKIDYHFWNLDLENDIFYNLLGEGKIGKGIRVGPFWLKKHKPIDSVAKLNCPVLYLHGDKDWVINYKHSRELFEKTKTKKDIKIIKGGPHAEYLLRKNAKELLSQIKNWFAQTLKDGGRE